MRDFVFDVVLGNITSVEVGRQVGLSMSIVRPGPCRGEVKWQARRSERVHSLLEKGVLGLGHATCVFIPFYFGLSAEKEEDETHT